MTKIISCARICAPLLGPQLRHFSSDFKKQSTRLVRVSRPIRRAPTIMVLSDFLTPVFLAFIFENGAKGSGTLTVCDRKNAGSLWKPNAPSLSRNQVFQKKTGLILNGFRLTQHQNPHWVHYLISSG